MEQGLQVFVRYMVIIEGPTGLKWHVVQVHILGRYNYRGFNGNKTIAGIDRVLVFY